MVTKGHFGHKGPMAAYELVRSYAIAAYELVRSYAMAKGHFGHKCPLVS